MKKGDKKKQQKALKRRTENKLAHKQAQALGSMSAQRHLKQARTYPLEGCWAYKGWEEKGMAVVVVARRQPDGNIMLGNYLVDHFCLGVKDAFYRTDIPRDMFYHSLLPRILESAGTSPISISPALAHELVYGSIEYAAQFGFQPHRDFKLAQYVLDPPDAHPRSGEVEFGQDGQPLYIAGPYDNVDAIISRLNQAVGPDNFHYFVPLGGDWDEDEMDWDGDKDDFEG